jgi:hypothetical protein
MKLFLIALFAAGVFSESSAKLLRGVSSDRDLQSRILGGDEANTGEYPDAASLSMQSFNVTILAADESPVSIPIEDLALMIFAMITTNDCNGDEISIVEVASALLEGLPNRIIPDAKVSATETKEGTPEDRSRQEDLVDLIVPAIGCLVSPEALTEVIIPLIRDFVADEDGKFKGLADLADLILDCVPDLEDLVDIIIPDDEDFVADEDGKFKGLADLADLILDCVPDLEDLVDVIIPDDEVTVAVPEEGAPEDQSFLEGLVDIILTDDEVSDAVTEEGAPEDQSILEDLIDGILPKNKVSVAVTEEGASEDQSRSKD